MKKELADIVITDRASVRDSLRAIDQGGLHFALVTDAESRLIATVTDGDARRGLLRGLTLDAPVTEIMRRNPLLVNGREGRSAAQRLIREHRVLGVPVVDDDHRIIGLEVIEELVGPPTNETWVVLMAGGQGVRLRPLTETVPKPMLPIGGRPILETIIKNFAAQGFRKFFIAVNYRRDMIQEYFKDGNEFGVDISYLVEEKPLGTAGALALLPQAKKPIIIMNGDLLTMLPATNLLRYHEEHQGDATVCIRPHITEVPFGVVNFANEKMISITEKPQYRNMVSAGIYVLDPACLAQLRVGLRLDMPELLRSMTDAGKKVCVFPIEKSWIDVGRIEDLREAEEQYESIIANS